VNWVKKGYLNTTFFHKTTSMRHRKNKILSLEIEREVTRVKIILGEPSMNISKYFWVQSPWTLDNPNPGMGGSEMLREINKPFTEEEIKATVWGLGAEKSPGRDDFRFFLPALLGHY